MARGGSRVLAIGDAIVDLVTPPMPPLPPGDHQAQLSGFAVLPGGNATNFSLAFGGLGGRIRFIGSVGADSHGAFLKAAYRSHGVSALLRTERDLPTGTTMALTWSDGSRALLTVPGANAALRERDIPAGALASADHVHRSGFWWTSRLVGRPTTRLLARARRAGATTSLDVSTDPEGWPRERVAAVRECLPFVDTFFGDEAEVCAIAGERSVFDAAARICELGARETIVHLGPRGAARVTSRATEAARGFRTRIDNPTGCGDVFNAGYMYARLAGRGSREALRFANACAALHLRDRRNPYPSRSQVERFLRP